MMNLPRTTRGFRWLALIVALVAVTALVAYAASRRAAPPVSNLALSIGPWTVDGLSVGMTREQCVAVLGEPTFESRHPDGRWRMIWDNRPGSVMAHLDKTNNLLITAQGTHLLDATNRVVVSPTTPEREMATLLPDFVRGDEQSPGGWLGVLPRHEATWYSLESDGVLYSVEYPEGAPLAVWVARLPPGS